MPRVAKTTTFSNRFRNSYLSYMNAAQEIFYPIMFDSKGYQFPTLPVWVLN